MGMIYMVGGVYYYAVKHKGRWVRRSSGSDSEAVAKLLQDQAKIRISKGLPLNEEKPKEEPREEKAEQTFADFADEYIQRKQKRKKRNDTDRDEDALLHLKPAFRGQGLSEVRRKHVDNFIEHRLEKGASPDTVQREIVVLRAIYNKAIEWERTELNPAAKMTVDGAGQPRERLPLEEYEITRLLEACTGQVRDIVEIALCTGMRLGEIRGLQKGNVDFLRNQITILKTKTGGKRVIPMSQRVGDILNPRCVGQEVDRRKKEPIFSIVNTQRPFKRAVKAAGIDDLRFHDLRHCAASYLLERGVDVRTTMQILGHKDPRMTLRVYASTTDKRMREAMDKLAIGDYDMTRTSRVSTESIESIVNTENL